MCVGAVGIELYRLCYTQVQVLSIKVGPSTSTGDLRSDCWHWLYSSTGLCIAFSQTTGLEMWLKELESHNHICLLISKFELFPLQAHGPLQFIDNMFNNFSFVFECFSACHQTCLLCASACPYCSWYNWNALVFFVYILLVFIAYGYMNV